MQRACNSPRGVGVVRSGVARNINAAADAFQDRLEFRYKLIRIHESKSVRYNQLSRAPVAQLDRASGFEPEGREFESLRARHILTCSPYSLSLLLRFESDWLRLPALAQLRFLYGLHQARKFKP